MDLSNKILVGRPYGGTAILWNKNFNAQVIHNYDHSIIGLSLAMGTAILALINVYLPYCSFENEDIFREKQGKLKSFCDSINNPNICFLGDFNAGKGNKNGQLFSDFGVENNLILSDKEFLPDNSFTYISDAHSTCTRIDHCICSSSAHVAAPFVLLINFCGH